MTTVMGQRVLTSVWELTEDEEFYKCRSCALFHRSTILTVSDFAKQVSPKYSVAYRVHRAALFK